MIHEIEWTGSRLPSKKNSKQLRKNFKTGVNFISSSDKYHEWEETFVFDIISLGYKIGRVKNATFTFYAPDRRKFDLTNKAESINDGLVKAKFLSDDNYECIPCITLIFGGVERKWRVVMKFEV